MPSDNNTPSSEEQINDITQETESEQEVSKINESNTAPVKTSDKVNIKQEIFDWIESLVVCVLAIIVIFTFILRVVDVDGTSMVPTLHDHDKIVITNLFYSPKRGDVVVLYADKLYNYGDQTYGKRIVKRIIGVEGDEIDIDFNEGIVYRNGEALDEIYVNSPTTTQFDVEFPITVQEDCVFVMGDNRNMSTDSRDSDVGMVNINSIMGKVVFKILPINDFGVIK